MQHVLCEGRNDTVFLSTLADLAGDRTVLSIDSDVQAFLTTFIKPYYAMAYRAVILGDRGRDVLISSYVPHLIRDLFGKVRSADLTIVTDDDNSSHDQLFDAYSETIGSSLRSRGLSETTITADTTARTFSVVSSRDSSYRVSLSFVWVPVSLEAQVRDGALCRYGGRFTAARQEDLGRMDPHRAIGAIVLDLGCTTEDLIRESVRDGWFEREEWFQECRSRMHELDLSMGSTAG